MNKLKIINKLVSCLLCIFLPVVLSGCGNSKNSVQKIELTMDNINTYLDMHCKRTMAGRGAEAEDRKTAYPQVNVDISISSKSNSYKFYDVVIVLKPVVSYYVATKSPNKYGIHAGTQLTYKEQEATLMVDNDGNASWSGSVNVTGGMAIPDFTYIECYTVSIAGYVAEP